jgi:hypothetical protein
LNKELQNYIRLYKNIVPLRLQKGLIKDLNAATWEQNTFYNYKNDKAVSNLGDADLDIVWLNQNELAKELMDITWGVIATYIKELNFSWFAGWHGFTEIRFNRYQENKEMDLHCDHIHSMFDGGKKGIPTLSLVGALNDDYEGGDFVMFEDTVIRIPAGAYLVFPSNFLYPHKVNPVTKGTRFSFVSWVW